MQDHSRELNTFARPVFGRIPVRVVSGIILFFLVSGLIDNGVGDAFQDLFFWVLAVPSLFLFLRSWTVGLRFRDGVFTYRSYFRTKAIPVCEVSGFRESENEDWTEMILGTLGEFFSIPALRFKNDEELLLKACAGLMWNVDRKLGKISQAMDPEWSAPAEPDDPNSSRWVQIKAFLNEVRSDLKQEPGGSPPRDKNEDEE